MTTVLGLLRRFVRLAGRGQAGVGGWAQTVVRRAKLVVGPGFHRFRGPMTQAGRFSLVQAGAARYLTSAVLLVTVAGQAGAQTVAPPSAPSPETLCVQVDVGGDRAGHLDCAAQTLQRAARAAQEQARAEFDTPAPNARSSDLTVGVVSQTAVRQRLGANFGTSVHPQRPVRPMPTPRPGGQP
ncbi:MAG: hypothetical protein HYU61_00330 [Brevundimonas diminuta]|jgi:hypothetical protein|uniref:hypothetical protein n=1 Tax=Brevundimonas diminuta TaxID=293 RepID=UPI00289E4EA4|nr:hypothetical protein [Brevundimonas diminuta]MBI2248350.1 hypothetical protein [Brevundimonas diminuta]